MFHIAERMFNIAKHTFSIGKRTFSDAKHKIFQGRNIILKVKAYIPFGSRLERIKAGNDASHQRPAPRPPCLPHCRHKKSCCRKGNFFFRNYLRTYREKSITFVYRIFPDKMTFRINPTYIIAIWCLLWGTTAPMTLAAQDKGITVVSDTTDNDSAGTGMWSGTATADSGSMTAEDFMTDAPDWWKFFLGDGSVWDMARSIFAGGSMLLLPLIILFGIILLPVLLIILLIVFLMRDRQRNRPQPYYSRPDNACGTPAPPQQQDLEKEKDRLVINIAIALGVTIFCIAYSWRFGTLLAIVYLCVQGGRYYNLKRAEKRNNDNNIL